MTHDSDRIRDHPVSLPSPSTLGDGMIRFDEVGSPLSLDKYPNSALASRGRITYQPVNHRHQMRRHVER